MYQDIINHVRNGEPVDGSVAGRPTRQLEQNFRYLLDLFNSAQFGEIVVLRNQAISPELSVGKPVYWNATRQRFEAAALNVTLNAAEQFVTSEESRVVGIVKTKHTSTSADILRSGLIEIPLTDVVAGTPTTGVYYLQNSDRLTQYAGSVPVPVFEVLGQGSSSGQWKVLVSLLHIPSLVSHQHTRWDLPNVPAGLVVPPNRGERYEILSPDSNLPGWLPADHVIFEEKAPAGAVFGYNLSATELANIWPPAPTASAILEWSRPTVPGQLVATELREIAITLPNLAGHATQNIDIEVSNVEVGDALLVTNVSPDFPDIEINFKILGTNSVRAVVSNNDSDPLGSEENVAVSAVHLVPRAGDLLEYSTVPEELIRVDQNGIWWMSDCYGQSPWPHNFDNVSSLSVSESESTSSTPADCPVGLSAYLRLWFTRPLFFDAGAAVLRLSPRDGSGLTVFCAGTDIVKSVGDLEIDFDISELSQLQTDQGALALKSVDDGILRFGPVISSIKSLSPEIVLSGGTEVGGRRYGAVNISAQLDFENADIPTNTIRLNGVLDEYYQGLLLLSFPSSNNSSVTLQVLVSDRLILPEGTTARLQLRLIAPSAGTVPADLFDLEYSRVPKPDGVDTLSLVFSPLTLDSSAVIPGSNRYFEILSESFEVSGGDSLHFQLARNAPDSYGANMLLLSSRVRLAYPEE